VRAIWSGSISFGLVNIPVKLFRATTDKTIHFNQLDRRSGARVRNKRVSEKSGREIDYDNIVKGYELDGGKYVVVEPDELESIEPHGPKVIGLEEVVQLDEIDPRQFDHTYWLAPADEAASKPYSLLTKALDSADRVAIGRFVLRTREHLAALRPLDGALALHTMLFADELVPTEDVDGLPVKARISASERRMADQLLDAMTVAWNPKRHHDTYRERVEDLIKRKEKGEEIVIPERPEPADAEVVDLMAMLEQSVSDAKGRRRSSRSSTSKKRTKKSA
jgi:DNA end-binding protein Ku